MTLAPAPHTPASVTPPAQGDFHGKGGDLFLLWLTNSVLTVLTLGIYFAWGKAKMFRFFYGNTEFAGSRFRFTGTGKEIFIGTLKALAVLLGLYVFFYGGIAIAGRAKLPALSLAVVLVFVGAALCLSQYALYSTLAYRASRARFREIGFRLEGSAFEFMRKAVPLLLLGMLSMGIALPLYTHWKIGRIYNNLRFGDQAFAWREDAQAYWLLALKGFFLSLLTCGIYYFFWMPKRFAFILDHLSVGGCRFRGSLKPGELFGLTLTNILILIGTLGIGAAWVLTRTLRFYVSRVALENPDRLETALQARRQKVGVAGEALGDAMDLGVGLGF
jgi:uncharacterized membrane protein YjgN (DUF898 family)